MNPPPANPLILGTLVDLPLEKAQPFFLSLERTGYRGEVGLVCGDVGAATLAFLRARAYRVNLLPYRKPFLQPAWAWLASRPRLLLSARRRQRLDEQLAPTFLHPNCARHFFYRNFLETCGGGYDLVMLTDVRDVLFQRDPFAFAVPDGLSVFLEDRRWDIARCQHTANQIKRRFGRATLRAMHHRRVACAGTIFGTTAAVREHLERVTQSFAGRITRKTVDQGVFNYLLHAQPPAKLTCFENFSGPVLSMARLDLAKLRCDAAGRILDDAGNVINTLHQYDRHPELAAQLLRRFGQA